MPQFKFTIPEKKHAALILGWRKKPWIAKTMYTTVDHGVEKQEQWIENCLDRNDYRHWLIISDDTPIGLINLQNINWQEKTTANGYYMGEDKARPLSGFIPPFLYNHAFFDLGMEVITGEVIADNDIMRLNRLIGHEETLLKGQFARDGEVHDVIKLRLTREVWETKTRYHRYRADFPWPDKKVA